MLNCPCSSNGSNRQKDACRSMERFDESTSREISASWRSAPRAASQPSFELHNIAASHATLSTQSTHDCPPRTLHQTPKSTHLLTSNPFPEREQQLRFMSASIENLKSFGMSTEFPHYVRPRPIPPTSTRSLGRPSLSLTPCVMVLLHSVHRTCQM